jgi:hypothetical protein
MGCGAETEGLKAWGRLERQAWAHGLSSAVVWRRIVWSFNWSQERYLLLRTRKCKMWDSRRRGDAPAAAAPLRCVGRGFQTVFLEMDTQSFGNCCEGMQSACSIRVLSATLIFGARPLQEKALKMTFQTCNDNENGDGWNEQDILTEWAGHVWWLVLALLLCMPSLSKAAVPTDLIKKQIKFD